MRTFYHKVLAYIRNSGNVSMSTILGHFSTTAKPIMEQLQKKGKVECDSKGCHLPRK